VGSFGSMRVGGAVDRRRRRGSFFAPRRYAPRRLSVPVYSGLEVLKEVPAMATATVNGLKAKSDAAWANINKQLQGMEPFLDKSDAPGEWTTRQVICHLLFEPGWDPVALLKSFSTSNLPVVEITSVSDTSGSRQTASLKQLLDNLDAQRKAIWGYLEGLSDADLKRKARIPLFKELMGNEEVPIPVYVGALFDYHWNDHAGQLAKIRKAAGLPDAR
jgi:hypothetical protein